MNEILTHAGVLLLSAVIGALVVIAFGKRVTGAFKLLLTFSGAYLMGMIFFHLVPEVFVDGNPHLGWYVIGGFMLQLLLEYMSQGAEHGHIHIHPEENGGKGKFPIAVFISLCLHALIEAMPLGTHHHHDHDHSPALLWGLAIHKLPIAIVLMSMFVGLGNSMKRSFFLLMIFAMMAPLGMFIYSGIEASEIGDPSTLFSAVNGILIGILLHISTTIIFESSDGHRFNSLKLLTIVIGIALSALSIHAH